MPPRPRPIPVSPLPEERKYKVRALSYEVQREKVSWTCVWVLRLLYIHHYLHHHHRHRSGGQMTGLCGSTKVTCWHLLTCTFLSSLSLLHQIKLSRSTTGTHSSTLKVRRSHLRVPSNDESRSLYLEIDLLAVHVTRPQCVSTLPETHPQDGNLPVGAQSVLVTGLAAHHTLQKRRTICQVFYRDMETTFYSLLFVTILFMCLAEVTAMPP